MAEVSPFDSASGREGAGTATVVAGAHSNIGRGYMAEPSIDELFERIKALVSETRYRVPVEASSADWVAEYDRLAGVHEEIENAWSSIYLAADGPRWAVAAVFVASMHHGRMRIDMLVRRDEERKRAMHGEGRWI